MLTKKNKLGRGRFYGLHVPIFKLASSAILGHFVYRLSCKQPILEMAVYLILAKYHGV